MKLFFLLLFLYHPLLACDSIGIQNNNPGNLIDHNWQRWQGAVGIDEWGHIKFKNPHYGIRAMRVVIRSYKKRGINTIAGISKRWVSPRMDSTEYRDYVKKICNLMHQSKNEPIRSESAMIVSISILENGCLPYPLSYYK